MGTRHLIAVTMGNEYKIAQYGQWDGYPEGQGLTVLEFLRKKGNIEKLKTKLNNVRFIDDEKDRDFIRAYDQAAPKWSKEPDNRTEEQKRWFRTYISRDIGANILTNVAKSTDREILLKNSISFARDSLSCEWAYVIDFDNNILEVYEGFNTSPIGSGRFVSGDKTLEHQEDKYEPVILVKTYGLDNLPSEKRFLADLSREED